MMISSSSHNRLNRKILSQFNCCPPQRTAAVILTDLPVNISDKYHSAQWALRRIWAGQPGFDSRQRQDIFPFLHRAHPSLLSNAYWGLFLRG
jgi:hypothetical protein